jgi:hypothetical protein
MGKTFAAAFYLWAAMALSSCGGGGTDPAGALPERAVAPQALAAAPVPSLLDASGLMNWAEGVFPTVFPGPQPNEPLGPFIIRRYRTGNFIGVAGDAIYILGPITGNVVLPVGSLGQFTCRVLPQNCTSAGSRVSGTVIGKGTPLAGAAVTLRDIAGAVRSTTTTGSGTYSLDVSNLAPPFVVSASGATAGGTPTNLVSVGRLGGGLQNARINITPWTTALGAMLSPSGRAGDLDAVRDRTLINGTLTVVITYSVTLLTPSLTDAGISPSGFDPISSALDAGDAMTRILKDLTVGTTPTNAIIMASSSGTPCKAAAQLGSCVRYSDPGTQTTTNPNVCGSDIATGAPIPCDSSLPLTSVPPPISINLNQAYNFGCSGCIFFGPADNYAAPPTQVPLRLTVVTTAPPVTATWFAHFSVTACAAGFCFSNGATTSLTGTAFENQAACSQTAAALASALSGIEGVSYSFTCTQSP